MIDHVLYGGGGCYPEVMARHSAESADLLDVLQQMALNHSESVQSETGVVHNDLNPGNILSVGDQVTGVVDWENTCTGDPAYDLAYLWYCIYKHEHVRPVLWQALIDRARPEAIAFWLSHIIVGFASGAMTYQDESWVGTRLAAARGALADLETLGIRLPEPRHPSTRT